MAGGVPASGKLKQHNFGQWESFWELVDIPVMSFVCEFGGDVRFGCYKPTINPNFNDRCRSAPLQLFLLAPPSRLSHCFKYVSLTVISF